MKITQDCPCDLSKLSNVADNYVFKKIYVYDKLVIIVNTIDNKIPIISGLVSKTHYDSDKQGY